MAHYDAHGWGSGVGVGVGGYSQKAFVPSTKVLEPEHKDMVAWGLKNHHVAPSLFGWFEHMLKLILIQTGWNPSSDEIKISY
jgi:hypothetical protein